MNENRSSHIRFSSLLGISLLLLMTLCCGDACESDTKISMDGKNPPTFELSGNGDLHWIEVRDLSPSDVSVYASVRTMWKITPIDENTPWRLPKITYGTVPSGFTQEIPAKGAPPPLIEEKPYSVSAPTSNANGDAMIFIIREGKSLKVIKSDDGSYNVQTTRVR